jgi:hypothetical protein
MSVCWLICALRAFFTISVDNMKDLQRFLRWDGPQRKEVFKKVCKWKIASRDLVPIIENYQTDHNLLIIAVIVLPFASLKFELLECCIEHSISIRLVSVPH